MAELNAASPSAEGQKLLQLEVYADKLFGSASPQERDEAQKALVGFSSQVEFIQECKFLLDNSRNNMALLLASSSMLKLLTSFWNSITSEQAMEMKNYIIRYLAVNGQNLPQFVISSLIQVVARVVKLSWLDPHQIWEDRHLEILSQISEFLSSSPAHYVIGLLLYIEIVDEANRHLSIQTIMQHRKIAVAFRDEALLPIFQISITTLQKIISGQFRLDSEAGRKIKSNALKLAFKCLTFDYIGTNSDEASDEFGALQIPSEWRETVEDGSAWTMFMNLARGASEEDNVMCFDVLVQLASCRRSLFSNEFVRKNYLELICRSCCAIIQDQMLYIRHQTSYTHFCRLLLTLKANYQLQELAKLEGYRTWIHAISDFTIKSFNSWEVLGNSSYYLVWLWAKLTMSIPYVRDELDTYIGQLVPQVCKAYIETRLKCVEKALEEDSLDDVFDSGLIEEHLLNLPTICRHDYLSTYTEIHSVMTPLLEQYSNALQALRNNIGNLPGDLVVRFSLLENQLAWLVYAIGTITSGQTSSGGTRRDEQLELDAKLIAIVFQFLSMSNTRVSLFSPSGVPLNAHVDKAFIHFFQCFRRVHIGFEGYSRTGGWDQSSDPEIFFKISDQLGRQTTQNDVLSEILRKVILILEMWATNYDIIHDTLILLSDLSSSYSSSKALTTLETANALLRNHGPTAFPFMAYPPNFKLRTQFYLTWARMVFSEANVDYFEDFMIPFDNAFETMYQKGNSGAPADEIKHLAVGMFRDLRGVLMAIHNRGAFQMFFDWFYPRYFQILSSAFEQYWEDSFVSIPALKFYEEFAHNKAQRIEFSSSSPNGIILFKETCKILLFYSSSLSKLLTSGNVESAIESDPYKYFLKGMSIVLDALANTLLGSYVNFGVFLFYQDDCYSNTIKGALQLLFCNVDLSRQIMLFDKVSARYYKLIEVLFRNHLPILVDLDSTLFMMLLHTLVDGLYHPDKGISSFAASAIDDLATYRFKQSHRKRKEPAYMKLEQHLMSNNQEDIFFNMLISLFSLILFEGASNLWAFSRPILSLILNHEQYFKQISNNITAQQPDSTRNQVSEAFDSLMENVLPNLETRNRDRFTQNLVFFTGMLKKVIVRPRF